MQAIIFALAWKKKFPIEVYKEMTQYKVLNNKYEDWSMELQDSSNSLSGMKAYLKSQYLEGR